MLPAASYFHCAELQAVDFSSSCALISKHRLLISCLVLLLCCSHIRISITASASGVLKKVHRPTSLWVRILMGWVGMIEVLVRIHWHRSIVHWSSRTATRSAGIVIRITAVWVVEAIRHRSWLCGVLARCVGVRIPSCCRNFRHWRHVTMMRHEAKGSRGESSWSYRHTINHARLPIIMHSFSSTASSAPAGHCITQFEAILSEFL